MRDPDSTTYVEDIESAEEFGLCIHTEAWRRGWSRAKKAVVLVDRAVWIWNLADQHFPGALQIVDCYHAWQHLWELSAKLFASDERMRRKRAARCLSRLKRGKIRALVKTCTGFGRRLLNSPNSLPTRLLPAQPRPDALSRVSRSGSGRRIRRGRSRTPDASK